MSAVTPTPVTTGAPNVRAAIAEDHAFVLGLVHRFVEFPLPEGRSREVIVEGLHADLDKWFRDPKDISHFLIVEDGGVPAGFAHLQLVDDFFAQGRVCHVSDLAVDPAHEGRGLASALLRHGEAFAREHGCVRFTLAVFPGNARARALYERHGLSLDMIKMGKPLDA